MSLDAADPLAVQLVAAIQRGDTGALEQLLVDHPQVVRDRIGSENGERSLLHIATDWPGHFPHVAETIRTLVARGADVTARFIGAHAETPLHWAASSDDVAALDALLDAGAPIDAFGGGLADGTALDDAMIFGMWKAARRLVDRGASASLSNAAALGLTEVLASLCSRALPPTPEAVTKAFWHACHGGQQPAAAYLADRGADVDWVGFDSLTPLDVAIKQGFGELASWLRSVGAGTTAQVRRNSNDDD